MSDFDFLKEFGKGLDREQPFDASPADWNDLQSRLDAQELEQKRRRRFAGWGLPLATAVGFLMLGAGFWQSERRADVLQAEIVELKNELADRSSSSVFKNDTTTKHVAVIIYDTIFRSRVLRRELLETSVAATDFSAFENPKASNAGLFQTPESEPFLNQKNEKAGDANVFSKAKSKPFSDQKAEKSKPETTTATALFQKPEPRFDQNFDQKMALENAGKATTGKIETLVLNDLEKGETEKNAAETMSQNELEKGVFQSKKAVFELAALPARDIQPFVAHRKYHFDELDLVMLSAPKPSRREQMTRVLRPQNAAFGLRGGGLFPITDVAELRDAYAVGLTGELGFGRRFRLLGGADFARADFKILPNELDKLRLPTPIPPGADEVLQYVQMQQPVLNYSLGLRYDFWVKKPLRPFVWAAWSGEQAHEKMLSYEYRNSGTEEENHVLLSQGGSHFNGSGLQIGLGADWFFRKKWSLGAEGFYQKQLAESRSLLAERFGARAGLKFHF